MKKRLLSLLFALELVGLYVLPAVAHSGRTDKYGGHYNRKTGQYHYHNGGSSSGGGSSSDSSGGSSGSSGSSKSVSAKSIKITAPAEKIFVGDTFELEHTHSPSSTTSFSLSWRVSDESIVRRQGYSGSMFKALAPGKVTITGMDSYSKVTASVELEIFFVEVESIALVLPQEKFFAGEIIGYTVTILPEDATDQSFTLVSSNPEVIEITEKNSIQCLKAGRATITARATNGMTAEASATVEPVKVESVALALSLDSFLVGDIADCAVTILPENATDQSFTLISSNPEVVEIASTEEKDYCVYPAATIVKYSVKCLKKGEATIILKAANGMEAKASVTVAKPSNAGPIIFVSLVAGAAVFALLLNKKNKKNRCKPMR